PLMFFLYESRPLRALHSFPTRRSSDLVHERVFGPEHPGTLASRRNVAGWTGEAGDAASARDQLAELLPSYEQVLGPDHPDTLTTDRKSTRLNSSHDQISYAVFCLKKKK